MGQALYRKYRSKSLAEMVGQEHITEALGNAIKSGRISHAYLFTGPKGVGKTSAARILAHEINKLPYADDSQHLDIIEIDAASNRRIDDIRDLRDKVHIAPTSSQFKVYIIDEVHMLTGESFNALLKTLEEPPAHVIFILATTEVHKLPATILSRTQRFNFRLVSQQKVIDHLKFIAKKEKITVDDEALALIADHGEGSFRDSINLLDQLANVTGGKITGKDVEKSLGLAPQKSITALIDALQKSDFTQINTILNTLESEGANSTTLIPQLIRALQEKALQTPALYPLLDTLLDVPRSFNPKLKLRTTLVMFALPQAEQHAPAPKTGGSNPTAPAKAKPAPVAAKPALTVEKPAATIPKPPEKKKPAAPAEPQQASGKQIDGITDEQWGMILAQVKIESAPLFGILRQAQPVLDATTQTLTLKFRYALHGKRTEDAKSKKILADTMLSILGGAPIITTEIDTEAAAPAVDMPAAQAAPAPEPTPEPPAAADDTTKSVLDIMGGGELVNA